MSNTIDFAGRALAAFARLNPERVTAVPGGVVSTSVRAVGPAFVVGGGSGHFPAFAGFVGPGLADAAVVGGTFASPAASQVVDVVRAAGGDGGVVLSFGNYTGDVLNFTSGAEQLRAEGRDVRILAVTDDIASAPHEERAKRRGVAGDLAVFACVGAAIQRGADLDTAYDIGRHANESTRSLGVAFSGCTLPGADAPLFTVPEGKTAVGMGIHGEPGLELVERESIQSTAASLVRAVLADFALDEAPAPARVALIVNGLGATGEEELLVAADAAIAELGSAGVVVVAPLVGSFCTSFDMAGFSVTLVRLDERLEPLWGDPLDCAALSIRERRSFEVDTATDAATDAGEPAARSETDPSAALAADALEAIADALDAAAGELGRLDAVAGDGDHGIGMQRGSAAASTAAQAARDAGLALGDVLRRAGDAWAAAAGGTSGAIWREILVATAAVTDDEGGLDAAILARAATWAYESVRRFGGAAVGDKTLVDALAPFASAVGRAAHEHATAAEAWAAGVASAAEGRDATASIAARRGRSKTHGDASLGTADPGAVSFVLVVETLGERLSAITHNEGNDNA